MPPIRYITFVYGYITITIGVFERDEDVAEYKALAILANTVKNPSDYRIKNS